ncbi:MAG: alpha-glucuronidase [Bacteroidales bacterium]|nr:alpha-glucuronidase [Bacteroidales bacterium]
MNYRETHWLTNNDLTLNRFKTFYVDNRILNVRESLVKELQYFFKATAATKEHAEIIFELKEFDDEDTFSIVEENKKTVVYSNTEAGHIHALFYIVRMLKIGKPIFIDKVSPFYNIRMINHWDNFDGSVERGYAGRSIFYEGNVFNQDRFRVIEYARMLASVGINALTINNVNVHEEETYFITDKYLLNVSFYEEIFNSYGIKLYLSVNFASPMELGETDTADPLDSDVISWWEKTTDKVYSHMPNFGGYLVKADSENRPGPFTYGRDHSEGANMLARALKPYGGKVFWRCFVYDCHQDWRDRSTDRARAAYDHFMPLDGKFDDNVILQVKNGPMDFQVREPVSPLLGSLESTNQVVEFQITQEYTGQQKHVFYLVPQWKEVLDFDTRLDNSENYIKNIIKEKSPIRQNSGIVAVSNVGRNTNWTGHKMSQANLYGFGRLAYNPNLTSEQILEEWIKQTFNKISEKAYNTIFDMNMTSWDTYESYTSPLGVGWMVETHYHYRPNIDSYEYSAWGTYHFADRNGLGVDRTLANGTGYSRQYHDEVFEVFENIDKCPDNLLLFFHHVPYTHVLKSGKTVIQHIYDTHFEGVEQVEKYISDWTSLENEIEEFDYKNVLERLNEQLAVAKEWRDQINTYFYRKSGIEDEKNRKIF